LITATAAHADVLAALHGAVFPEEPWDGPGFAALLSQPGMTGLINPAGGFLLLRMVADEAEIITIGVVPKRQGIGRALLTTGLAKIRPLGVSMVYLEVASGNTAARRLYESFGFTQSGLRQKYYINGEDALILSLSLSE
jgi:ribosomal-protein-alanine N-acetyltransferase